MKHNELAELRMQYCAIMEEIKARLNVISGVLKNEYTLPKDMGYELCYLQLRMICELIAFACFTAHGDMPEAKSNRLKDAYKADAILRDLERLHQAFYPVPVDEILDEQGALDGIKITKNGSITKKEIARLYGECGDVLHRGKVKSFGAKKQMDLLRVVEWHNKIMRLLTRHFIAMKDKRRAVYVILQAKETGAATMFDLNVADTKNWPDFWDDYNKM